MTDKQIKTEFNRWINAKRPYVWIKRKEWKLIAIDWNNKYEEDVLITDDEYAELRKAYHDEKPIKMLTETGV